MTKGSVEASQITHRIYFTLSVIGVLVCVVLAGLSWWGHMFISDMVKDQLAAEKIYFPAKGSAGFDAATFPTLQKYAGQLVDTPQKAEAFANDYIGQHLKETADGKVYAEVSALARQNPKNATLQTQKQTLFMGETLRGTLLTSGYGFGMIGQILGYAAVALAALAGLFTITAIYAKARS